MEELDEPGEWWLPERPERKVAGRLTYAPGGAARLELIGGLRAFDERGRRSTDDAGVTTIEFGETDLEESSTYPLVHGLCRNQEFSLVDCFQTRLTSQLVGGPQIETILANQVFRGAWITVDEPLAATAITVRLRYLPYWMTLSGLSEQWTWNEAGAADPIHTVTAHLLSGIDVDLAEGFRLAIHHEISARGDRVVERGIAQNFKVRIDAPALTDTTALIELANDFRALVAIGIHRPAPFESVEFWHPDVVHGTAGEERSYPKPVAMFAEWGDWTPPREKDVIDHYDMLFTWLELGEAEGAARWMATAARHRTALGRVLATREGRSLFTSDVLLNRAAALESFDRVRTGDKRSKFKARMKRCAALAGAPFAQLVGDVDRWAEVLRVERNDIAHHLGRLPEHRGAERLWLGDAAYWLFVICMLRDAQVPDAVFSHLAEHRELRWLRAKLQAVIAAHDAEEAP